MGFCDKDGNLLESYDTGVPLSGDLFGLYNMSFRLSGDKLKIIGQGGKGHIAIEGVFNLKTYVYTDTLATQSESGT